jgi:amino acid transporter
MFPPVHPTSVEEKEFLKEWAIEVFAANLLCSWVGVAATLSFSLLNGFPASLVWGSLFAAIGTMLIALSLAEMVAMYIFNSYTFNLT